MTRYNICENCNVMILMLDFTLGSAVCLLVSLLIRELIMNSCASMYRNRNQLGAAGLWIAESNVGTKVYVNNS